MSDLVLPTALPWDRLLGRDLEECVYWLLDSLGAKDLVWRLGGAGGGAPDQGRDLEATFYTPSPDDELTRQRWWVECRGRSGTVEASSVKASVINATEKATLDVLLIATNTTLSNPTREWIREWQVCHPRPAVRLWDRANLERLLSRHPEVVVRLFREALTADGKLAVVRSRFWNYALYADQPILTALWEARASLAWEAEGMLAVLASEHANGDPAQRPWPMTVAEKDLLPLLVVGLSNLLAFEDRAGAAGSRSEHYRHAVAHILEASIARLTPTAVRRAVERDWKLGGKPVPGAVRDAVLGPVIVRLLYEMRDACMADCRRVVGDPIVLSEQQASAFWRRLQPPERARPAQELPAILIENLKSACTIGIALSTEQNCPLNGDLTEIDLRTLLPALRDVIARRTDATETE